MTAELPSIPPSFPAPSLRRSLPGGMVVDRWHAPDGWPLRRFALPHRGEWRGSVLFLGGRADFLEKYLEAFDDWAGAGWAVAGFDWRGQGASGLLHPAGGCHIDDFAVFADDLAAFVADWQRENPAPYVVIGHSLGGHILLRAVVERRIAPDGIVLLAPMLGIRAGPLRGRAIGALGQIGRVPALRRRTIWSRSRSPGPGRITSCPDRDEDKRWWKEACPELARSGPTWGWLSAATRSIAHVERMLGNYPAGLRGLTVTAGLDPVVDNTAIARVLARLPAMEHADIAGAGHEILRERDELRIAALDRIRRFLSETAI